MYCYLKCIVYDKLLKLRQSFRITLYIQPPSVTEENFLLKEYLQLLLTYPTIFIFIFILAFNFYFYPCYILLH